MKLSICLPTYGALDYTKMFIEYLEKNDGKIENEFLKMDIYKKFFNIINYSSICFFLA